MENTIAKWVVEQLKAWGVRNIYGLAGDAILPLVDGLCREPSLHFYGVKHECAAAFMASAEAKLTGKPGVCIATSGPGAANLLNGLSDAKNDRVPVLAITGQVASSQISTDTKQYVDQGLLLQAAVDFSGLVTDPQACKAIFTKAFRTAIALGTTTHVSVAKNIWKQPYSAPIDPPELYLSTPHRSSETVINDLTVLLNQAERPAILGGRGIRNFGSAFLAFAERWQAGICLTLPAKGSVPGDHPLVLGGLGEGGSEASTTMLESADLILVIGATWWPKSFVPSSRVVQIDEDPLNIGRNMPVAYGAAGNLAELLPLLTSRITACERTEWINRIKSMKEAWLQQIMPELLPAAPVSPGFIMHTLDQLLERNAIISLDVGDHTIWFNRIFAGAEQEVLLSGHWRSLGFGLPAAISAKLIHPERQVIAITGDGGFAQSMAEFLTAVRYWVPIIVIVVNNGWLALEKDRMELEHMKFDALSLTNPDFAKFADICGGKGFLVSEAASLEAALRSAFSCGKPAIVDVHTSAPIFPGLIAAKERSKTSGS